MVFTPDWARGGFSRKNIVPPLLFSQLYLFLLYCKHMFQTVLTSVLRKPKKLVNTIHPPLMSLCDKSNKDQQLIPFLVGLNEDYKIAGGSILMMKPLPNND